MHGHSDKQQPRADLSDNEVRACICAAIAAVASSACLLFATHCCCCCLENACGVPLLQVVWRSQGARSERSVAAEAGGTL